MFFRTSSKSFDLPEVIDGCRHKKAWAQRSLVEKYYSLAKRLCLRYAASDMEAEEMVDDGFLKIFDKIQEYDTERPFEPWLSRIMINTAIDYFRKHSSRVVVTDLDEAYQVACHADQLSLLAAEELLSLIQQLPPAYRMVFNLCAIEGYDHAKVAEMLGISEGTSRSNLTKARAKLQLWVTQLTGEYNSQSSRHIIAQF